MIRRTAMVMLATLAASPLPAQQVSGSRLAGTWSGYWTRAGDTLPILLQIARDSTGSGYRATFSSERLWVSGIPFAAVRDSSGAVTMVLRGDRTTTLFWGALSGDTLRGEIAENDVKSGSFVYRRMANASAPPGRTEIKFTNKGVTLAGTILMPPGAAPAAGVVFLHGSGAEGRWASQFMAEQAVSAGLAALIFDKRGVGASTGDWRQATLEDLADDGATAVAILKTQLVGRPVGIFGHSQGGTLAPLVAARAGDGTVAFIVASAASGVPTDSTEEFSVLNSILPRASTAADSVNARAYVTTLVNAAYRGRPRSDVERAANRYRGAPWFFEPPATDNAYWKFSPVFNAYRALDWWSRVRVPVLLIYGGADQRVPAAESAARISATLLRSGNTDVTARIFPDADHTFRLPPPASGWPKTAPGMVESVRAWLGVRR